MEGTVADYSMSSVLVLFLCTQAKTFYFEKTRKITWTAGLSHKICPFAPRNSISATINHETWSGPCWQLFLLLYKKKQQQQIKKAEFLTLALEDNKRAAVIFTNSCRESILSLLHEAARCSSNKRAKCAKILPTVLFCHKVKAQIKGFFFCTTCYMVICEIIK